MFQPPMFKENDIDILQNMARSFPFATLFAKSDGKLSADHIPVLLHDDGTALGQMRGHIAKANPLFLTETKSLDVLVVFQGPSAYISPSWYASKSEHGRAVPTWNYISVQAHGVLRFTHDRAWLLAHLNTLTDTFEQTQEHPWSVADAPSDYIDALLHGLVGLEIEVASLTGQYKLSQNKSPVDKAGVIEGLGSQGIPEAHAIAALMRELP